MEKLELEHLKAVQRSRELAKLERDLETKRRERQLREDIEDVRITFKGLGFNFCLI
jgi:predicted  nucleic acid-binding Zn-ribbon protein